MYNPTRCALGALTLSLALAACQDQPTLPTPARPEAPVPPPVEMARFVAEQPEGYTTPGELRTGFIYGRYNRPVEVTYEVQGELAIWEGDIVIGKAAEIATSRAELLGRSAPLSRGPLGPSYGVVIDGDGFRWSGGVVPYEIAPALPNQSRVTDAIAIVEAATAGVTLVPRDGESDFVRFVPGDGCSSPIGKKGGQQDITLADGCSTGNTAHEILHSLGMYHEHTRCDRDDFVIINTDNIEDGKEGNFNKNCAGATDIDVYDPGSIMHYGPLFFSKNGLKTIEGKAGVDESQMGQRAAVGPTDIITINTLYGSNNAAPSASIAALASSYPEGTSVPFDASGSTDADDQDYLTYAWTFGDGTCAVATPPAACSMASPSHTYADNGSYAVTVTVSDGFLSDVASATANITNVVPVVNAGADGSANEGSLFSQSGSFTDPGADTWTATVDYGDGAGAQALALSGKTFSLSHTYIDNGVYTVTVTVTDDEGGVGSDEVVVTVANVAPTVEAGSDASLTSGETFNFSGSFTDPGIIDFPWGYVINWGFGPNTTGSTNDQSQPILASRQVCVAGTYSVNLAVTDKDGGTGTDALTLTVPYFAVSINIEPGGTPNPINLKTNGRLPVAILSTATFDAAGVDPSTLTLGDGSGVDVPIAQRNNGTYYASTEDVNRDGRADLVVHFEVQALVANGDLTAASTELVLRGFLSDGCTNFQGSAPITVRP